VAIQWTKHPILKLPTAEQVEALGVEKAFDLWKRREALIKAEKTDPFNHGMDWHNSGGHFQHWKAMDELFEDPDITTIYLFGGNRCIEGGTPIYNPLTGEEVAVSKIKGTHKVLAKGKDSELVTADALEPFVKGEGLFLEVFLLGGRSFKATEHHRVMRRTGRYIAVSELRCGDQLWNPLGYDIVTNIRPAGAGPVWDFRVPFYDNYWACGAVHHNSGKTEYMAKRLVQKMAATPGYAAWVGGLSGESSIQVQQHAIHRYIPKEWARQRRGVRQVNNIAFTPKNGFSNGSFIGPNGSSCRFKNYTQDVKTLEGANLDLFWADELVPQTWVETMKYRLIDRRGKMVNSFTPIEGYSPTVKHAMAGHVVTKWLPCDKRVMPEGRMPFIGRTRSGDAIIWFFSEHNPYISWDHFKKSALSGKTSTEKEIRAYGYVRNPIVGKFPRFGDAHIVKPEQIPSEGTNYMCVDPTGGDRNWFMVWLRVDNLGRMFVYREWPNLARYGEWAVPSSKADGSPGSAQKADCGRNLAQYRKLIRELERGEREPLVRYIDPRAGKAPILSAKEGNYSLIDHLAKDVVDAEDNLSEPGMVFIPAAHTEIDEGVQAINNLLSYNMEEPITVLNEPKLYISEECGNLIYSLREWTGEDKDKGACKDPADALRYLITMDPFHVSPGTSYDQGGGHY
jgi:hypothetical protein